MRIAHPEVLLTWPKPNYVNPKTRNTEVIVCASICMAIITIVISARLYTRAFIVRWFGLDDWFAMPAAVTGIGYCIVALLGTQNGWYRHLWDVPLEMMADGQQLVIAASLIGLLNVGFTKISILCLYRRLTPEPWFRTMVYIVLGITVVWMVVMTITNFLLCIPLHAYWEVFYDGQQRCFNLLPYFVSFSAVDLALDVTIWTMPLFFIVPMRIPRRQKWTLYATFAVGLVTIAAAASRLPSLVRTANSMDWSWEIYHAAIWTAIEATVGLTCASVPTFKPLIARYAPTILGSIKSSPSNSQQEPNSDSQTLTQNTYMTTTASSSSEGKRFAITKTTDIEMLKRQQNSPSGSKHEEDFFDFT